MVEEFRSEMTICPTARPSTRNGNHGYDISRCCHIWHKTTVRRILEDERYIGTYIMGKREVTEVGGHHVRLKEENQWVKLPDHHPAIISRLDIWVTKIVEADLAQAVLADHPAEMLGHVVGAQDLPTLIHADVIQIVPAVRAFEQPPVFDLPLLLSQQQFLNSGDQRQRAEAGLGFEHVLPYRDILPQLVLGSTRC